MNKKARIITLIASAFLVLLVTSTTYFINSRELDSQELKEDLSNFSSYINETDELTNQFLSDKINFPYTKTQIQYLNEKNIRFLEKTGTKTIPPQYANDVKKINELVSQLSYVLSVISSSKGNSEAIRNTEAERDYIKTQIDNLKEKYE